MSISKKYKELALSKLPKEITKELDEIKTSTNNFEDEEMLEIFKDNFNELYGVIEKKYPDAIKSKAKAKALKPIPPAPKYKRHDILTKKNIDSLTAEECRAILKERAKNRATAKERVIKAKAAQKEKTKKLVEGAEKARRSPKTSAILKMTDVLEAMAHNISRSEDFEKRAQDAIKKAEEAIAKILDVLNEELRELEKVVEKKAA